MSVTYLLSSLRIYETTLKLAKNQQYTLFYKNILYKNIEAHIWSFGPNILAISKNIRLGIYLTVPNESLDHGMQFKAISEGEGIWEFQDWS